MVGESIWEKWGTKGDSLCSLTQRQRWGTQEHLLIERGFSTSSRRTSEDFWEVNLTIRRGNKGNSRQNCPLLRSGDSRIYRIREYQNGAFGSDRMYPKLRFPLLRGGTGSETRLGSPRGFLFVLHIPSLPLSRQSSVQYLCFGIFPRVNVIKLDFVQMFII